jgi:hypothetical protein
MTEWWTMHQGAIGGGVGGGLIGILAGTIGAMAGIFASRGRFRALILGSMLALVIAGGISLTAGIVAVTSGQPYHVWYPLVLGGAILAIVCGSLLPVVSMRYRQAEQRRLSAADLRRG